MMSENLLTRPLSSFHVKFVSAFNELPKNGKVLEITKRIIIAVASLFAYPVFGCLYLMGRFYDSFLKRESGLPSRVCVNISEKMGELKQSLLHEITTAKAVDAIQSAKIFFNLKLDGSSLRKDYVIIKRDKSAFDNEFLTQAIESIIKELGESIQKETGKELSFMWDALIKDTNGTFARAHGLIHKEASSGGFGGGTWKSIPVERAEKAFEFVLRKMGREIRPQLNDQFEFA